MRAAQDADASLVIALDYLVPFVYAEAMAHLGYTAATLLPDIELHIPRPGGGDYVPHDYDGKLRGPVRIINRVNQQINRRREPFFAG